LYLLRFVHLTTLTFFPFLFKVILVIVPELIGIHWFSYVAGLAAFLFVTLSLGTSNMATASVTVADSELNDNDDS
jgi:hypothetical protein